jgi:hypothetical protein
LYFIITFFIKSGGGSSNEADKTATQTGIII